MTASERSSLAEYEALAEILAQKRRIRQLLESHSAFTNEFFPALEGVEFLDPPHAAALCKAVDMAVSGESSRVLITLPPGYIKTIIVVMMLIARGFAINPASRFIHASYSGKLALDNSNRARDLLQSEAFQATWPIALDSKVDAKGLWKTVEGGGVLASPAGGEITGFRAGRLSDTFSGALIIDDPLKPDDAFTVRREEINGRWHRTFKSRLADESVPVIVIMQRLHKDDFAGFLLSGGADGQVWDHLYLPIEIDSAQAYPAEFTHGRPIDHGLPDGPLWSRKHDVEAIRQLKLEPYTYAAQYGQRPSPKGGAIFKEDYLARWHELPEIKYRKIWADTAQKTGERNDYSVFQLWGQGFDGKAYLLDQVRGKYEVPDLLPLAKTFYEKAKRVTHPSRGALRGMAIEDKASGTGLIQELRRDGIPIEAIPRNAKQDKYSRALDVVPFFASGMVCIPQQSEAAWVPDYVNELLGFDALGNAHDDQVDPTIDAVKEICGGLSGLSIDLL